MSKKLIPILLLIFVLCLSYYHIPAQVKAVSVTPTIQIKIHRIQAVDPIESILEDGADWTYTITVYGKIIPYAEANTVSKDVKEGDDVFVDVTHIFNVESLSINFVIKLVDRDLFGSEQADIGSGSGVNPYYGVYDLKSNTLTGDKVLFEGGYYKTSGDFDGKLGDENDANLWFQISDNYEPPRADAGPGQSVKKDVKVNFDGSRSSASAGSEIIRYEWDFESDGKFDAEGIRTSYSYLKVGSYTVTLRVTDNLGETSSDTALVSVEGIPPTAFFNYSPLNPSVRDNVRFEDKSLDPDGTITSWYWEFGDGYSSNERNPLHTYNRQGSYIVRLTVRDNDELTGTFQSTIEVKEYLPPVANAGPDQTVYVGDKVNFDGAASSASLGFTIIRYEWDFESDGVIDAEGQRASYTYTKTGQYTISLKVTDNVGETGLDTLIVTVSNKPPKVSFTFSPSEPSIKDTISFVDASTDPYGTIVSWFWEFGDGSTSTEKNPSHKYADKGVYTVKLTVTDNDGAKNSLDEIVKVQNLPPKADFTFSPGDPKAGRDIQFTDKSTDPEGKLTKWLWDFGDGFTSSLTNPTHEYQKVGSCTVTLTVTDDEGASNSISISLTVKEPPLIELPTQPATEAPTKPEEEKPSAQPAVTIAFLQQLWLPLAVAVIVVAIIGVVFASRRRKRAPPSGGVSAIETKPPPTPPSPPSEVKPSPKVELEKERIMEMLKSFKEMHERGDIAEEKYAQLKAKYEKALIEIDKDYLATARTLARLEELRASNDIDEDTYQRLKREYEQKLREKHKRLPVEKAEEIEKAAMKFCIKCGKKILREAKRCPECGAEQE